MPSTVTHTFIGLDTIDKLNNKPKEIINNHIDNYKIYCQNMDILYFYHIYLLKSNKVQRLGHRFHHEHIFDSFDLLIEDNKKNKDLELFTFISGLITHYQADSIMHPFINSFTDFSNESRRFSKHFEVETYLDNYYVNERLNKDQKRYNNSKFLFNYTEKEIIKEELDKLFNLLFDFSKGGKIYYRSLKEMAFTYKYIRYDKYGIKKFLYQIIDLNPFNLPRTKYLSYHFDLDNNDYYLNLNHNEWTNRFDTTKVSTKSFLDLYEDVTNKSSVIINDLYDYIFENKKVDTKRLIKNIDYGNGLESPYK